MILYKNVDICDLESILKKSLLSIDESGNNNWQTTNSGGRADNATDVVYLFHPTGDQNSFPQYGVALVEAEVSSAVENAMAESDVNKGKYIEYVCERVHPENIKAIYIPKIFIQQVGVKSDKIIYCNMKATYFRRIASDDYPRYICEQCTEEELNRFALTAKVGCSSDWMYFRGIDSNGEVLDLSDIQYIIDDISKSIIKQKSKNSIEK